MLLKNDLKKDSPVLLSVSRNLMQLEKNVANRKSINKVPKIAILKTGE